MKSLALPEAQKKIFRNSTQDTCIITLCGVLTENPGVHNPSDLDRIERSLKHEVNAMSARFSTPMCLKQAKELAGSWCALNLGLYAGGSLPTTHVEASVFTRRIQNPEGKDI